MARDDFFDGVKLALLWRGPIGMFKAVNDYDLQVEDLRNGSKEEVPGTRLKFYRDSALARNAIMSHVLSSETEMPVEL